MTDEATTEPAPAEEVKLPEPGSSAQITPEILDLAIGIVAESVDWAPPRRSDDISPMQQAARRQQALAIVETLARRGFRAAQLEAEKAAKADDLSAKRAARASRAAAKKAAGAKKRSPSRAKSPAAAKAAAKP